MESFDPISGVWQPMPSLSHDDFVLRLVVFEDTLVAFARRPGLGFMVHKYNPETQLWQPFPAPGMSWLSAAVVTFSNEAVNAHKI